jgi:hypothetical protein
MATTVKTSEEIAFTITGVAYGWEIKVSLPSDATVNDLKLAIAPKIKWEDISTFHLRYQNTKLGKDMPVEDIAGRELFWMFSPAGEKH